MPVFVEDPVQFSKEQLRSALVSHNVELPPADSKKQVYVDLYIKHIGIKNSADFSSDDDEDQAQNYTEEEESAEVTDMVDLSSLTDDQLKNKLLQYGIRAGPIVASTRALYERKLQRLMAHPSQMKVNGKSDAANYSDSEEDEEEDDEEESGSEQLGPESAPHAQTGVTASTIENRLSPQSKTEERCSQMPVTSRVQWDVQQLKKNTRTNTSLYLTPEGSPLHKRTTEPVTDVLMIFPDAAAATPTGITATKRRPIKGAAGRPVQFKYPENPVSPATLERREIQKRLVPLWVQILIFLLVICLLYLIYLSMESPPENPFTALLDSLSEKPIADDVGIIPSSQDTPSSEAAV